MTFEDLVLDNFSCPLFLFFLFYLWFFFSPRVLLGWVGVGLNWGWGVGVSGSNHIMFYLIAICLFLSIFFKQCVLSLWIRFSLVWFFFFRSDWWVRFSFSHLSLKPTVKPSHWLLFFLVQCWSNKVFSFAPLPEQGYCSRSIAGCHTITRVYCIFRYLYRKDFSIFFPLLWYN